MLNPADELLTIHLEDIVHLPDTLGRKCLLVHMDVSIAGTAIRCVHIQIYLKTLVIIHGIFNLPSI
jgi:hypothetical protein